LIAGKRQMIYEILTLSYSGAVGRGQTPENLSLSCITAGVVLNPGFVLHHSRYCVEPWVCIGFHTTNYLSRELVIDLHFRISNVEILRFLC
jgi:hypothetical protein